MFIEDCTEDCIDDHIEDNYSYEYVSLTIEDIDGLTFNCDKDIMSEMIEIEDIDIIIVNEYNQEVAKIESEIVDLNECMLYVSQMIGEQGNQLDAVSDNIEYTEINVDRAVQDLAVAENKVKKTRAIFRDVGIIASGVIIGSVGLAAGPVVGLMTILLGAGVTGATVHGIRKYEKKHGTLTLKRRSINVDYVHYVDSDNEYDGGNSNDFKHDNFLLKHFPKTYLNLKYYKVNYFDKDLTSE